MLNWLKNNEPNRYIECCVKTPQFNGSKDKFHMHKQEGTIDKFTWEFKSDMLNKGDHNISFHTREEFEKFKVSC